LLLLPVGLFALGLAWFIAAWGVFLKDMNQVVPMFVQMLMFLSPVFYPASAVPAAISPFYRYNPLGVVIESSRGAIAGRPIDWGLWGLALGICAAGAILGHAYFRHSRDEFADAL
jgi:lipopolysaccharide transport system permease protein